MLNDLEKLKQFANELEVDLVENYKRLGLKASGKWAELLRSEVTKREKGYSIIITGANYSQWLENGRAANKDQSKEGIKKFVGWAGNTFLKKWVEDKGLNISPFAVAYKIARKGINVPNQFNAGGLISDVLTLNRIDLIKKEIGNIVKIQATSDIIKTFKDGN